jgi:hypothetical protein
LRYVSSNHHLLSTQQRAWCAAHSQRSWAKTKKISWQFDSPGPNCTICPCLFPLFQFFFLFLALHALLINRSLHRRLVFGWSRLLHAVLADSLASVITPRPARASLSLCYTPVRPPPSSHLLFSQPPFEAFVAILKTARALDVESRCSSPSFVDASVLPWRPR